MLTRLPGFILLTLGLSSLTGTFETSTAAKVGLLGGSAAFLGVSGTFAGIAESNYVQAVEKYNRSPSGGSLTP